VTNSRPFVPYPRNIFPMSNLRWSFDIISALRLFPHRHFALQLVAEVFEEDHLALRLFRSAARVRASWAAATCALDIIRPQSPRFRANDRVRNNTDIPRNIVLLVLDDGELKGIAGIVRFPREVQLLLLVHGDRRLAGGIRSQGRGGGREGLPVSGKRPRTFARRTRCWRCAADTPYRTEC
jgi:hypothetical protein